MVRVYLSGLRSPADATGVPPVVRRSLAAVIVSLVIAGVFAPAAMAAPATDQDSAAVPRVVVIVGPSGAATKRYRAEARAAAAIARTYTRDVTELYSPNATWPAVREALQGASVVIYMGHGNGWPSKYRDSLYPPTQNGFGLNPAAGGNDANHQYFGEGPIAEHVRLAANAVVLLNHLCYASGNSEPGVMEGTPDQARQRVDNFAAGFIQAGAAAVIAEAYASPNHVLRTVLGGQRAIESAWRTAPTRNGNIFAFESARSPGYVAQMDPERDRSGFTRSIVLRQGLASADVLRSARGNAAARPSAPVSAIEATRLAPSLLGTGIAIATPVTQGSTVAGGKLRYKIPFEIPDRGRLPASVQASVRWDLIEPVAVDLDEPTGETPTGETPTPEAAAESDRPDFGLISAERLGDIVAPRDLKITKTVMAFNLATPAAPGRYRLTLMLHDADGVAYDAATQALVPSLLVRVTGDMDAGFDAPARLDLAPGAAVDLPVWIANLGKNPWGHPAIDDLRDPDGGDPAAAAHVTGSWVALGSLDSPDQLAAADAASVQSADLPAGLQPRKIAHPTLRLFAPSVAGEYLLVLDIVTPESGSLTASGVEPAIIRVTVGEQAAPTVAPAEAPTESPIPTEGASTPPIAPPILIPGVPGSN
jgi:hypothetical protein